MPQLCFCAQTTIADEEFSAFLKAAQSFFALVSLLLAPWSGGNWRKALT